MVDQLQIQLHLHEIAYEKMDASKDSQHAIATNSKRK
jgi:hypothetical protein